MAQAVEHLKEVAVQQYGADPAEVESMDARALTNWLMGKIAQDKYKVSAGDTGMTYSALRPYGNVNFGGLHMEAMVEGGYIPPQTQVRVVSVNAGKIIVEPTA